jgi:hypothetical protein
MKSAPAGIAALCAALAAAAVTTATAQTPSQPVDECIWSAAPAPLKDAMLEAGTPQEVSVAMAGKLTGESVGAMLTACKAPMDASGSAMLGQALMGHALQVRALGKLSAKYPGAQATFDAQWPAIPQGVRDRFDAILDPSHQAAASDADFNKSVLALMDALKLDQADGQTMYIYLAGRSHLDILRRPKTS